MLSSLTKTTPREQYRLTLVDDGGYDESESNWDALHNARLHHLVDHRIIHSKNIGLGPSINEALAHINSLKAYDTVKSPLTCYVQDDVLFKEGWLAKLSSKYMQLAPILNLGFASGHSAVEHKEDPRAQTKVLNDEMYLNKYIRATCMMADQNYWMSMWPIPPIDPETGQARGRPHDGLGSGVDWHFVRVHQNSVCRTGKTNLIMPGLVMHNGYKESTWLKRELPESDLDKESMP